MTVHVEQAVSEVVPEPEPHTGAAPAAEGVVWTELERWRAQRDRARRDAERTQAEGYGD
jgi:hypothetical protein